MNTIIIDHVTFGYTEDIIINDLSFTIHSGELVAFVGANGSGKSTLLKLILGELKPDKGTVTVLGKDIQKMKSFREIGYVPQMNVLNIIAFPITCLELVVLNLYEDFGLIKIPRKKHLNLAKEILFEMGLGDYINVPYNELSGGLQQRVMIARAMINRPKVLAMDEPTAGVDQASKEKFMDTIQHLNETYGLTILLVTHELDRVKDYLKIDRVYKFGNGGVKNVRV